jgi:transposase InsO family protein
MIYGKSEGGPVCCEMSLAEDTGFLSKGRELVYHRHYATREDAIQDIFKYIEVYNRTRRHSTLGYDSPAEYEAMTRWLN